MLRSRDMKALASVFMMLLMLSHITQGAPTRDGDIGTNSQEQRYRMSGMNRWLLRNAQLMERIRRTHPIDAGFLSRHNAISNYLKAVDAQQQARNPFGPGRRKRTVSHEQ